MQHTVFAFDLCRSIKTNRVLGDVVDIQVREAAWSAMARQRIQADATAPLASLRRWESTFCGHMAGLASVINTRLAMRLEHLVRAPQDLISEAFVAALLLLRCDRPRYEPLLMAAWREASSPDLMDALAQAMIHGGLLQAAHWEQLADCLTSHDLPRKFSAARIIGARRLPVREGMAAARKLSATCPHTAWVILQLMADGAWPLDVRPLELAFNTQEPDTVHGAERVLHAFGLPCLAARGRQQLQRGQTPSLLALEALALVQDPQAPAPSQDLTLLQHAADHGRMGPLVAHALGLTGSAQGARLLLHLMSHSSSQAMLVASTEGFCAITGVEARLTQNDDPCFGQTVAQELSVAWGVQAHVNDWGPSLRIFGRPGALEALVDALPMAQVGRWQSLRRMLLARSMGTLCLSPWALLQQQVAELESLGGHLASTMGPQAVGLGSNSLTLALDRSGAHL